MANQSIAPFFSATLLLVTGGRVLRMMGCDVPKGVCESFAFRRNGGLHEHAVANRAYMYMCRRASIPQRVVPGKKHKRLRAAGTWSVQLRSEDLSIVLRWREK